MLSLEVLCHWSFPTVTGASLLSLELPYCRWSFPDFRGALQSSVEFPSLLQSAPVFAGVPPCPLELLLLPQSPFPSEFFGDSLRSFPMSLESFPVVSYDAAIAS